MNISNRFVEWMSIYREGRYISTLNLELIADRTKFNRNSGIEPQRIRELNHSGRSAQSITERFAMKTEGLKERKGKVDQLTSWKVDRLKG